MGRRVLLCRWTEGHYSRDVSHVTPLAGEGTLRQLCRDERDGSSSSSTSDARKRMAITVRLSATVLTTTAGAWARPWTNRVAWYEWDASRGETDTRKATGKWKGYDMDRSNEMK